MSDAFSPIYSDAYDLLYDDKDYPAECDLIERIFHTYGDGPIQSVVDLGCGTGNHSLLLAERGYEVVGVDRSESMLGHARRKAACLPNDSDLTLCTADVRSLDLERHFDAALMMFAVLSYQLENGDVLSALRAARRHLRSGGLLIFDIWYGPAVLHQRPSQRINVVPTPQGRILRVGSGELDSRRQVCTVQYHLWRLEEERVVAETGETHSIRYFFPLELDLFLQCAGFATVRLGAFPEFDQDPDETTWNVLGLARAA